MLVRFRSFRLSIHPSIHRHPEMSMVTWASPTAKRTRWTRLPWRGANPHRLIVPKKSSPNYPYPSDVENFEKLLKSLTTSLFAGKITSSKSPANGHEPNSHWKSLDPLDPWIPNSCYFHSWNTSLPVGGWFCKGWHGLKHQLLRKTMGAQWFVRKVMMFFWLLAPKQLQE